MRKLVLIHFFSLGIILASQGQVTVTVTNPTNTTPNLGASYTSLANAVNAVNLVTSMSGPVTLTCATGTETAPAGGYSINAPGGTSAANTITFTTSGTVTLTASASLTAGSLSDAIIKLTGADYITISGFTIQENAANTTTTPASNNMTEWGIALLRASTTDGAQNNTIQNNTISLNRSYSNTFGIYSNTNHAANAPTSYTDITNNTTAPNNANKTYGNSISNVNMGIAFIGSHLAANMDNGNDIGGNALATGNTITNWGGAIAVSDYAYNSQASYCICVNFQVSDNVAYNNIISASVSGTAVSFNGIRKEYFSTGPTGTFTSSINNNTVTMTSAFTSGSFIPIYSAGITAASTATLNINNNSIVNCVMSGVSSSSSFTGIYNQSVTSVLNISSNVIRGYNSTGTNGDFAGIDNSGAVVNTINITNNKIGDAVSGAAAFSVATSGNIRGIVNNSAASTTTINMNNNSVDGINCVKAGYIYGLINNGSAGVAINMNNNLIGSTTGTFISFSGVQSSTVTGVINQGFASTTAISIQGNDIRGINQPVEGSNYYNFIASTGAGLTQNVSNNTFTNLAVKTGGFGGIVFIAKNNSMAAGASWTCSNNSIVTGFTASTSSGFVGLTFISSQGSSVSGSTMTETGNNFSNVTITSGTMNVNGIVNQDGAFVAGGGPAKTITNNTFNNITGVGQLSSIISVNYSTGITCTSNTISNISSSSSVTGIDIGISNQGTLACSSNTISNISGQDVKGIQQGNNSFTTVDINNNNINGLSCTSTNIVGIQVNGGTTINIYDNLVYNLSGTSSSTMLYGINVNTSTTNNIYRNKVYNLSANNGFAVYGLYLNGSSTTTNVYNNFFSDLKAPNADATSPAIYGIAVMSTGTTSNINLYYNSIYLNASSTGTNFSTVGVYHQANVTATIATLKMVNNIVVNTSTPKGTGVTAAYRRSGVSLANYDLSSDYNNFYAGPPSSSRLIFYDGFNSDQTLAAYQVRVAPRDANDVTVMPNFTSATDLHLTTLNCLIEAKGTPIGGYTTDIDNSTRNASTPDIGADEFSAATGIVLAGVNGAATCDYRPVSGAGTTYTANACGLIGFILPSGGSPVSGDINACVTLDATQQFFNAEPYVQRHYDIEPVTSNTTSTSATITLYFTNADFVNFNTNNPLWPKLPTVAGGGSADPNRSNLRVTQYHGPSNSTPSNPNTYPLAVSGGVLINPVDANIVWNGSYWAVTFDVTGFSGFYVHTNLYYPLAVSINYFHGVKQGTNHILEWKITCNTAKVTMALERSANSNTGFGPIAVINSDAQGCVQPFGYTDINPLKGMNYYRLKITDNDGKISYSNMIALLNAASGSVLMSVTPNPVQSNGLFKLNMTSTKPGKMELLISDVQGRIVRRQTVSYVAGYNSIDMNVAALAGGIYYIRMPDADPGNNTIRFVKHE